MYIKDATPLDVIKEAWDSLPKEKERGGKVYVEVDIEDGQIFSVYEPEGTTAPQQGWEETIFVLGARSKAEIIFDWIEDELRDCLSEDELYSCTLDMLHERYKEEIEERISEILQRYPHLT